MMDIMTKWVFNDNSGPELGLGAFFASDDVVQLRLLHQVDQHVVLTLFAKIVMTVAK